MFPKGSKLVHNVSRQIENLREERKLLEMENAWFHGNNLILYDLVVYSLLISNLVGFINLAFALFLFLIFSLKDKSHAVSLNIPSIMFPL